MFFCETFASKLNHLLRLVIGDQNDLQDWQIWEIYNGDVAQGVHVLGWTAEVDDGDDEKEGGSVDLEKRKARAVDNWTRQAVLILQNKAQMSSSKRFRRSFSITQQMALCARFFSSF